MSTGRDVPLRTDHPMRLLPFFFLMALSSVADAQATSCQRGNLYLHWGYNRARYSASDIRFHGPDHDFTLRAVRAYDRPTRFDAKTYFGPASIWIPQYNYRVGYFFRDNWSISLGLDHMKYVVRSGQNVRMDGHVGVDRWPDHAMAEGSREVGITSDVLTYEHTDGLNLLSIEVDRHHRLWQAGGGRHAVHAYGGLGIGPVIPRTDVRLFGEGINNRFHLAGFGVAAQGGMQLTLFRALIVRTDIKGGHIRLPSVLTTGEGGDRASQHFMFVEWAWHVGASFPLVKERKAVP